MTMSLAGRRITVMGLGRFGGGVGVTRWLVAQGADVLVTDLEPEDRLTSSLAALKDLQVDYRLGGHNVSDFTTCDLVVVNPAVNPRENRFLRAAAAARIPLTSEIRLLINHLPNPRGRTIGVTGTAGKSTTTAMIGHILAAALGATRVHVGGNLGGSLLERLPSITADDWVVVELSSFMLDDMRGDGWSPHAAVVTNISANHIDRHGTLDAYAAAKQVILAHQDRDDVAVLGASVRDWPSSSGVRRIVIDRAAPGIELRIPGEHNRLNATMAAATCETALQRPRAELLPLLADFAGLPHRLQFVGERNGVRCYNDSKSTTPEAALLAVHSFDDSHRIHLIAGGYDKGSDLTPIARLTPRLVGLYSIGATGRSLVEVATAGHAVYCETLVTAFDRALDRARPGDILLLSPACASWDQFENYEKRGEAFTRLVLHAPTAATRQP